MGRANGSSPSSSRAAGVFPFYSEGQLYSSMSLCVNLLQQLSFGFTVEIPTCEQTVRAAPYHIRHSSPPDPKPSITMKHAPGVTQASDVCCDVRLYIYRDDASMKPAKISAVSHPNRVLSGVQRCYKGLFAHRTSLARALIITPEYYC